MNRRGFLQAILTAGVAPAFVGASVLMPVTRILTSGVYGGVILPLGDRITVRVWRRGVPLEFPSDTMTLTFEDVTMPVDEYVQRYEYSVIPLSRHGYKVTHCRLRECKASGKSALQHHQQHHDNR